MAEFWISIFESVLPLFKLVHEISSFITFIILSCSLSILALSAIGVVLATLKEIFIEFGRSLKKRLKAQTAPRMDATVREARIRELEETIAQLQAYVQELLRRPQHPDLTEVTRPSSAESLDSEDYRPSFSPSSFGLQHSARVTVMPPEPSRSINLTAKSCSPEASSLILSLVSPISTSSSPLSSSARPKSDAAAAAAEKEEKSEFYEIPPRNDALPEAVDASATPAIKLS